MLGIIAGTGLNQLAGLELSQTHTLETPYGDPSAPLQAGRLFGVPVVFLPRHGDGHTLPPHAINYRANLWAMRELGVNQVLGVAAVGGITEAMAPASLVLPHDLIDYTWGRAHSYSADGNDPLLHVEFAPPYDTTIRTELIDAASRAGLPLSSHGVHGVTQGPRLETAAEVRRLRQDGCDIVGMTGMPEAALARELDIAYACLAVVVNWAAGIGGQAIHAEIEAHIATGMQRVRALLQAWLTSS